MLAAQGEQMLLDARALKGRDFIIGPRADAKAVEEGRCGFGLCKELVERLSICHYQPDNFPVR